MENINEVTTEVIANQRCGMFFADRWPIKEMGMTTMDYSKVKLPEAQSILETCCNTPIHEGMDEEYIRNVAKGIRKVAKFYAV